VEAVGDAYAHVRALFAITKRHTANAATKAFEMEGKAEFLDEHGRALAQHLRAARALLIEAYYGRAATVRK